MEKYISVKGLVENFIQKLRFSHYCLSVSHSDYRIAIGGTEKVIHAEAALFNQAGISYIQFYPHVIPEALQEWEDSNPLIGVNIDGVPFDYLSINQLGILLKMLSANGIAHPIAFHIHHLLRISSKAVERLLDMMPIGEVVFFVHDYYTVCPQINLLYNNELFCGDAPVESLWCAKCDWGARRSLHITPIKQLLATKVTRFIAPSDCAKQIWSKFYSEFAEKVRVIPHQNIQSQKRPGKKENGRIRLAYVGYQADNKGWNTWRKLARRIDNDTYELFHIGASQESFANVKQVPVSFIEDGQEATIAKLKKWNIDVAFLWSICPETYSFTVFESLAAGCFILTNPNSGNIAQQVRESGQGIVLPSEQALWQFLQEKDRFKEMLREKQKRGNEIKLAFNPTLVTEETALIMEGSQLSHKAFDYEATIVEGNPDTMLMLEREGITTRQIFQLGESLSEARNALDWIHSQRLSQRITQKLRRVLNHHPRCKNILKIVSGPLRKRFRK